MKDFIYSLFTKENVTFIIAVAGFGISLFNLAHRRKSISARIVKCHTNPQITSIYIAFSNNSELPISITRISLELNGRYYDATDIPRLITTRTRTIGREVVRRQEIFSTAIPFQIGSLGATTCLAAFERLPTELAADSTQVTLLVGTNRGKALKMSLELPQAWADPNITP